MNFRRIPLTLEGREPEYEMKKERGKSEAGKKADTNQYGFFRGDRVTYDVTIRNTGDRFDHGCG